MKVKTIPRGERHKRGLVVESTWVEEVLEDGTVFRLNRRIREVPHPWNGTTKLEKEQTLQLGFIGPEFAKKIQESKYSIMETSVDYICTVCKTSDHIVLDKDPMGGHSCTRCWGYIPRRKV